MRFVCLRHELPDSEMNQPSEGTRSLRNRGSHWDFMLERDGVLWTWCLQSNPFAEPRQMKQELPAVRLKDHRIAYLDYEGPISDDKVSGNRGSVRQVANGQLIWDSSFAESVEIHDLGPGGKMIPGRLGFVLVTEKCRYEGKLTWQQDDSWNLFLLEIP